jgi:hypothetical protein
VRTRLCGVDPRRRRGQRGRRGARDDRVRSRHASGAALRLEPRGARGPRGRRRSRATLGRRPAHRLGVWSLAGTWALAGGRSHAADPADPAGHAACVARPEP